MYEYRGVMTRAVDGDTIDVTLDLGFNIRKTERLRLLNVDSPERGEPGWAEATEYVKAALTDQVLRVRTYKADSFGRYLADVWLGDENFNQRLISSGHAKPYVR